MKGSCRLATCHEEDLCFLVCLDVKIFAREIKAAFQALCELLALTLARRDLYDCQFFVILFGFDFYHKETL